MYVQNYAYANKNRHTYVCNVHHPLFLAKPPPLNLQTVQAPLFKQPSYILVFGKIPPLKLGFFHELQEY